MKYRGLWLGVGALAICLGAAGGVVQYSRMERARFDVAQGTGPDPVQPSRPDLVATALVPDYALGPHTASLGLAFTNTARLLPQSMQHGVVVGQHGSWNRRPKSGYRVIYIPFVDGKPAGMPQDILTGFLTPDQAQAHGRPVGVVIDQSGALLVADDVGNTIWRVTGTR